MNTYGDVMPPPTEDEMRKRISITNVLRERERCAKIAETWVERFVAQAGGFTLPKFDGIRRKVGNAIAANIRAQSEDFKTLAEEMEENGENTPTGV